MLLIFFWLLGTNILFLRGPLYGSAKNRNLCHIICNAVQ